MIRRAAIALLMLFVALPSYAGFAELRGALEQRLGSTMWIPFFGFVRTAMRVAHPNGVHDLQLAVFEDKGSMEPDDMDRIMRSYAGRGYEPLVRVRSRKQKESVFIYAKPLRDTLELLILTNDKTDTVLVRVVVDPDQLGKYLDVDHHVEVHIANR